MPNNAQLLTTRLKALASQRTHPKTLCPSEVARSFSSSELQHDLHVTAWRDLMPALRSLCFQLRDAGDLEILQRGEVLLGDVVVEDDIKGPIRIRLKKTDAEEG